MKDQSDLAQGWLAKAESDLSTAKWLLEGSGPYDTACFHAQQAVEKALKAFLAFHQIAIPRIHDLEELQRLCLEAGDFPKLEALDFAQVTGYAVALCYDLDFWPDPTTAEQAVSIAQEVYQIIREVI